MPKKEESKKKIWFKAKTYGWGWYPCTWQGWLIILVFLIAIVGNSIRIEMQSNSMTDTLGSFIIQTLLLIIILIIISYKKGEPPRWRWGENGK